MSPSTAERLKVGQTPFAHRSRCLKQSIYAYIFLSTYLSCYLQPSVQKRAEPLLSFNLLIWKRASRHSGVWFFIFHVARWFVPAALAKPTFRPSPSTNHWKTQCFATFRTLRARVSSFFWLFTFSSLFFLLLLSSLLWISPYCRKFDF